VSSTDFLQSFEEFLGRNGWPTDESPWTAVERWESLVEQATAGYRWGFYEFTNELGVRDLLAKAFDDERLSRYDLINMMRERVADADDRLRKALLIGVEIGGADKPWWRRYVLARAGEEYADDVKRLYGIELQS
jgi:hypothetical protein